MINRSCATQHCEPCQAGEPSSTKQNAACAAGLPVLSWLPVETGMRGPSKAGVRSCRIPNVSGGLIFVGRGGERVYQALYRKWRPRTFDECGGAGPYHSETLKRQVATGRLSHAYLFTGTRGRERPPAPSYWPGR